MIVTFIVGAISLGMVFLYGCVGESSPKKQDTSTSAYPA